jgi:hypothetical protein
MNKTTDRKSNPLAPPQQAPVSRQGQVAKDGTSTTGSEPLGSFLAPSDVVLGILLGGIPLPFAGDDAE